jgi:septal ring-binding cell division protein DamX
VAAGFRARRRATSVRVLAVRPRGERRYRVVVGAFPTRAEAQAALRRRRASLPADSRLLAVPASGAKAKRR